MGVLEDRMRGLTSLKDFQHNEELHPMLIQEISFIRKATTTFIARVLERVQYNAWLFQSSIAMKGWEEIDEKPYTLRGKEITHPSMQFIYEKGPKSLISNLNK